MRVAILEVLDRAGNTRQVVPITTWPATVGRAIDCDAVLDDPFVAAHHLTLDEADGAVTVLVGESVNGAQLQTRRLKANERATLGPGDAVEIGTTTLRVRRTSDALAPERPLAHDVRHGTLVLAGLVLASMAWNGLSRWLQINPDGRLIDYVPTLLTPVLGIAFWAGLWSLGSRLFRSRFDYWRHARIALSYILSADVAAALLPILAYVFGWTFLSRIAGVVLSALLVAMVVAHLTLILPSRRRALALVFGVIFVTGTTLFLVRSHQVNQRYFSELYVTTLAPPAIRLAAPVSTSRYIEEARGLKSILDAHVNDDTPDNQLQGDDEE